uniref:Uncharacterized protein n=1 Tax=Anguilla anguilla TaxID=7936 RepID=A0A0E9VE29_ANGAN
MGSHLFLIYIMQSATCLVCFCMGNPYNR